MKQKSTLLWSLIIVGLLLILFVLMLAVVAVTGVTSSAAYAKTPFSLASLTSGETNIVSCGEAILPSFIGVVLDGNKQGVCAGDSVITEIYTTLAPWIADALASEPVEAAYDPNMQSNMLVIEYHTALPCAYVGICAAALTESDTAETVYTSSSLLYMVKRLFLQITPGGKYVLLTEADDGSWLQYVCPNEMGEMYPTAQKWAEWTDGFRNHFYRFAFAAELEDDTENPWEIVFLDRMRTRSVILGDEMGGMLRNRQDHMNTFVRLFNYNPDKLSSHEENDGTLTIVENHGILRLSANSFLYTANAGGGVELSHIIGYREDYTVADILRSAWTILEKLRDMRSYYVGADAGITLTEVVRTEDGIRLVFSYTFDNLLLSDCAPAMTFIVTEDYRLIQAEIYTIAVRSSGEYSAMYTEMGVRKALGGGNTILVYPVNFEAQTVFPKWTRVDTEVGE